MLLDEHRVGRGLATTRRRSIHHVVVKQRKSMEQFQSTTRIDHARGARITAAPDESPVTNAGRSRLPPASTSRPISESGRRDHCQSSPPRRFRLEQSSESIVNGRAIVVSEAGVVRTAQGYAPPNGLPIEAELFVLEAHDSSMRSFAELMRSRTVR